MVARALAGEEPARRSLVEMHREAVFRLVRAQTADVDAALDLTQETFIAAFVNLHRYDVGRPFRAWVMRIALNKCRDWHRRRLVRRFFWQAKPIDDALSIADEQAGPDIEASARQELDEVRRTIERLPDKLRTVLLLRTVEELSQAEVAGLLGVSEKAVETRLYRARAKLLEMLRAASPGRV
ncbi:MAG: RNA polymerase sigma factor [Sphingomonadales bacterium]|nr:RNA polymerase sigma factor [Sphingomonadales bacterium]